MKATVIEKSEGKLVVELTAESITESMIMSTVAPGPSKDPTSISLDSRASYSHKPQVNTGILQFNVHAMLERPEPPTK